ncbi:MAG: type I-U CRISPR-associated RAMP protein Csb1/Cas7u [Nitrospira sp.]|nr:type I-U CRISPR-associated RAMP protein Csb1/Cas7u [Nitrospira sp.]MDE0403955.1 type I-U CRISPR-associated RAMP protein Csb1/Cas7u [Nitrospira sp.]MDE0487265.1 type I-U CRISPR-associated RAMP protein Csb1/Cas7u [Nitrospira sp.]
MTLDLQTLKNAIKGTAAAFRCVTDYQPAGGAGDKIFPPTYEGGKYATEERFDPATGEVRKCVLLDSVQSQANRMELALLEAHRAGNVSLPLLVTRFDQEKLLKKFTVNSLEAPHRVADALFRDSLLNGTIFRKSEKGRMLDTAEVRNATGLFGLCPTALVFGLWDSTGPRGGLGCKFQRAVVSEIVGYDAEAGVKTASRIDPAAIEKRAGPVFRTENGGWTLTPENAKKGARGKSVLYKPRQGKDVEYDPSSERDIPDQGRPSVINHGNVTPSIAEGGFTLSSARQTTTLSLAVLRRLRFPLDGAVDSDHETDLAARTTLAALGLAAGSLARVDTDLRSRCQLFAEQEPVWELLDRPGESPQKFKLGPEDALKLLKEATAEAKDAGLPWEEEIKLTPSPDLVELVRRSQELASTSGKEED